MKEHVAIYNRKGLVQMSLPTVLLCPFPITREDAAGGHYRKEKLHRVVICNTNFYPLT